MPRPARPKQPEPEPSGVGEPSPAWAGFVGFLIAARYLQPTEGVVFGDTLWQAQLWIAAAATWCWFAVRSGSSSFRWSVLDGLAWSLALGHALSTIPVFMEGGDRRAAVNVVWEWVGLAAMVFLVRQVLPGVGLTRAIKTFAASMVAVAALGIWQHHVSLPATAARYGELLAEEAKLTAPSDDASPIDHRRLAEVRRELAEFGAPQDAASRRRWEDRVRFSTEPFGTFALANTLGGLLAAALPLIVAALPPRPKKTVIAGLLGATGIVLYCLILTKSRTAWAGLAAGGLAAIGLYLLCGKFARRTVALAAAGAAGIVLLTLVVAATGGLDQAVLSEAPKSLRFRLDYWTGTLRVLAERPLLGTGPANFRTYYLEHRSLGASEEIAAPHNLFFDVWTAGGLLSLVALIGLLAYTGFRFVSTPAGREADETATRWSAFEGGALAAFPAVTLVGLLTGQGLDWRPLMLGPVAAAALIVIDLSNGRRNLVVASGAGCCALAVHLLGADGIEFPAVVQTLLLLVMVADRTRRTIPASSWRYGLTAFAGLLAVTCFMTATRPVLNAAALTSQAMSLVEAGAPGTDSALVAAAEADPLATRPLTLRAELATANAIRSGSTADSEVAARRWNEVLAAHPREIHARRRLAELLLHPTRISNEADDAKLAVKLLADAARLSPTDVGLHAALARAAVAAGHAEQAREAAEQTLRIDDANRAAGHSDVILSDTVRDEMRALSAAGNIDVTP